MIGLAVLALLARSRRWWGNLAVVGICPLPALFFVRAMGEAFAPPTPHVPRAVLVTPGVVGAAWP